MANRKQQISDQVQQVADSVNHVEQKTSEVMAEAALTLESLRTQTDRVRGLLGLFGFGRRILVPPDEIHAVVGDGRHILVISKQSKIFGQTADRPSSYWLNPLTQVIKLKTISFTVPIRGPNDEGVQALDKNKVSFRLWAHAVAKLNPDKAEVAAQRVGLDATSLINTITEVGTAELVAAAATMELEGIIASRQKLAEIAFPQVNQILSELGYDLALLTITKLDGIAYRKLTEQAGARISKETSIATNREQVAELHDNQARKQNEAEIQAETEKKLAAERLEAERDVETATLDQQEALAVRRHEVELRQVERDKGAARAAHEADLTKVQLAEKLSEAEVQKDAQLAQLKAEREAELRAMQQQRDAKIHLAETEAEAERLAVEQVRKIERDAERTTAEAKRLEAEQLAAAERAKKVALVEAQQLAEAMEVEAEAESRALKVKATAETEAELIRADAETKAELVRAEAEASATEKRAKAAKIRAEATRAETAAPGLAQAEVEAAGVEVAEKRVAVTRAEGLAKAEVAQAQAVAEAERQQRLKQVEIDAQREMVELYEQAPILVDMEKLRMQFEHEEKLAMKQIDAYLKAFEAIAPSMHIRIYGDGGQVSRIMTDVMSLARGLNYLGEEIPAVGSLLAPIANEDQETQKPFQAVASSLRRFMPYIRQVLRDVNPRMFSSLRVADLVDRLQPVVAGHEDLSTALTRLKENVNFRVVGDLPLAPLLRLLGIRIPEETQGDVLLTEAPPPDAEEDEPDEEEEPLKHPTVGETVPDEVPFDG